MTTGIKSIDKLIASYGLTTHAGKDAFQSVIRLRGGDAKARTLKLPWCMYQKVMQKPVSSALTYYQYFLPHRQHRLASFLVDEKGNIVEQVYYLRDGRGVKACKKLQVMLQTMCKAQLLAA
ncbi:hypothetical protein [Alteromonas halophila]|uniref:Uncharacterized protein n=1 Tax=Alteromonas halophila TaxID=516698 RepID=A0A918JQD0_9ALTE|nr:hypothetical protein [Alteromonas halophila]GGW95543.1 hypothetical protein GCM10007391_32110 [Alteromonas halophila]